MKREGKKAADSTEEMDTLANRVLAAERTELQTGILDVREESLLTVWLRRRGMQRQEETAILPLATDLSTRSSVRECLLNRMRRLCRLCSIQLDLRRSARALLRL